MEATIRAQLADYIYYEFESMDVFDAGEIQSDEDMDEDIDEDMDEDTGKEMDEEDEEDEDDEDDEEDEKDYDKIRDDKYKKRLRYLREKAYEFADQLIYLMRHFRQLSSSTFLTSTPKLEVMKSIAIQIVRGRLTKERISEYLSYGINRDELLSFRDSLEHFAKSISEEEDEDDE